MLHFTTVSGKFLNQSLKEVTVEGEEFVDL